MRRLSALLLSAVLLTSCGAKKQKQLVGKWNMTKVYNDGVDVSSEHNPQNDRWVTFAEDGSFQSGGTPYGENMGTWSFNEAGFLFLNSDAGEGDDSYWEVTIDKGRMTWTGAVFEFTQTFSIELTRAKNPT